MTCAIGITIIAACGGSTAVIDAGSPDATDDAATLVDATNDAAAFVRTDLTCPGRGVALELATGAWLLRGDCAVAGVSLSGAADVRAEAGTLTVAGDIHLDGESRLRLVGAPLHIAQHAAAEFAIAVRSTAILEIEDAAIVTNGGEPANLFLNLDLWDDALARFDAATLDETESWILAGVHDRARLESIASDHVPTEVYPDDDATVVFRDGTNAGVWLRVPPGAAAVLEGPPAEPSFSFEFGRGVGTTTGVGYLVEIENASVGVGVLSTPRSALTVRRNPGQIKVGYVFGGVTEPQLIDGLSVGGPQTALFTDSGRRLELDGALLNRLVAWQIYVDNTGVTSPAIVTIRNGVVNEIGALANGRVRVEDSTLQFAVLGALGPASRVEVARSVVNSQIVQAVADGVVELSDSRVFGARIQARGSSRIRLLDTELLDNRCHPGCLPMCVAFDGLDACNGFNPATTVTFDPHDSAAILVARLPVLAPVAVGAMVELIGDAGCYSLDAALAAARFRVSYRATGAPLPASTVVVDEAGPVRDGRLGIFDTSSLTPGDYVVRLELLLPTAEQPLAVERTLTVTP